MKNRLRLLFFRGFHLNWTGHGGGHLARRSDYETGHDNDIRDDDDYGVVYRNRQHIPAYRVVRCDTDPPQLPIFAWYVSPRMPPWHEFFHIINNVFMRAYQEPWRSGWGWRHWQESIYFTRGCWSSIQLVVVRYASFVELNLSAGRDGGGVKRSVLSFFIIILLYFCFPWRQRRTDT